MNAPLRDGEMKGQQSLAIADCDVHPMQSSPNVLYPYLSKRWRDHMETFGGHIRQGLVGQQAYPRMMAAGQRADAYPEAGGPPGSDLDLLRRQLLDACGVEWGMLIALGRSGMDERNLDYAAAMSHAVNEWQLNDLVRPEPRLRAGIVVPQEHPEAAAQEIDLRAGDPAFVQVVFSPRAVEPLGRRRYWPLYEAATRNNLPIGWHPAAAGGGAPSTGSGWPTYYFQEHSAFGASIQANVVSLIFEGVFERFPTLKVALMEGGFSWAPALAWRMDKHWERMRAEVPHVKRPPSEYMREHFWFATQPMEEPERPRHLEEIVNWIGWDRVMFSSDYPHWDFDDPRYIFKFPLSDEQRTMVFRDNAKSLYGLS